MYNFDRLLYHFDEPPYRDPRTYTLYLHPRYRWDRIIGNIGNPMVVRYSTERIYFHISRPITGTGYGTIDPQFYFRKGGGMLIHTCIAYDGTVMYSYCTLQYCNTLQYLVLQYQVL